MISIIIPNYNTEKFIGKCVERILNQTYSEFELILVDDGSKDNTFSELKKYEQTDSRVKAYQNDKLNILYFLPILLNEYSQYLYL